jgi:hypothetical protein
MAAYLADASKTRPSRSRWWRNPFPVGSIEWRAQNGTTFWRRWSRKKAAS